MDCANCNKTNGGEGQPKLKTIPYVAHEFLIAKAERRARIFGIYATVATALLLISNTAWLCSVIF